jgi:hypothetical protein
MAVSRKGKRSIVVDGEELLWRFWNGGAHVIDLRGQLNVKSARGLVWVRGPRFRSVEGCGGLHRCFRCPDFFFVASGPAAVAKLVRWAVRPGRDPEEFGRADAALGSAWAIDRSRE